jgi:hypothetical protein
VNPLGLEMEDGYEDGIDTTLTPPGTQYGATEGKAEKRTSLRYGGYAALGKPLQRLTDRS